MMALVPTIRAERRRAAGRGAREIEMLIGGSRAKSRCAFRGPAKLERGAGGVQRDWTILLASLRNRARRGAV